MPTQYIYRICQECGGDSVINRDNVDSSGNPVEADQDCTNCINGKILWGYLQDELEGEE